MKTQILFVLFVFALFATPVSSQSKFGLGLVLGTKAAMDDDFEEKMNFGLNARADIALSDNFSLVPNATLFLPFKNEYSMFGADVETTTTLYQVSADVHYAFINDDYKVYGIAGADYNAISVKASASSGGNSASATESDGEFGFNLGIGAGSDSFFGELVYNTEMEQVEITIGVLFGGN